MSEVVAYTMDDGTEMRFEIDPLPGYRPSGAGQVIGTLRDAARPVIAGAAELFDQIKELRPDEVGVKFGIKVSGTAHWLVAKAASEAAFEVTLTWRSGAHADTAGPVGSSPVPGAQETGAAPGGSAAHDPAALPTGVEGAESAGSAI
jgi:hypothetical protein